MWEKCSDLISMWVGGMGLVPSYLSTYLDASVGARHVAVGLDGAASLCPWLTGDSGALNS